MKPFFYFRRQNGDVKRIISFELIATHFLWIGSSAVLSMLSAACNLTMLSMISSYISEGSVAHNIKAFIIILFVGSVSGYYSIIIIDRVAEKIALTIRVRLYDYIVMAPLSHIESIGEAKIYSMMLNDVMILYNLIRRMPILLSSLLTVTGGVVWLCIKSPEASMWVILFLTIGIAVYLILSYRLDRYFISAFSFNDIFIKKLEDVIKGIKELKLNNDRVDEFRNKQLFPAGEKCIEANFHTSRLMAMLLQWGRLALFLLIVILYSSQSVLGFYNNTYATFVMMIIYLMEPLNQLLSCIVNMSGVRASLSRISSIVFLAEDSGEIKWERIASSDKISAEIIFSGVIYHHKYGNEHGFCVGPISLNFSRGEVVYVIGGNGSGKSTFLKLLSGLYIPEQGSITYAGEPVNTSKKRAEYRQNISAIFQDFHVFDTILHHEQYSDLITTYDSILKELGLSDSVNIYNNSFSTTNLSQGQRKRLALIQSLLENKDIYVFDEWAADQEPSFKEYFYYNILPALKERGKIVIVATHDDRFYHTADRIIKFDSGMTN